MILYNTHAKKFNKNVQICERISMKSCTISMKILKSDQNLEILSRNRRFQNLVGDFAWLLTPWQRVHEVEHGHFTPLVFTTTGGMGDAAGQVSKRLANLLTEKLDLSYGEVMGWIRCKLSFALVRSAIMCIRGARSRMHFPVFDAPLDIQIAEVHL